MKRIFPIVFLVLLVMPYQAYAALVNHGTYSSDDATGLDWLHLTQTANMSWGTVDSLFGSGGDFEGWRYATGLEFEAMATSLCQDPDLCSPEDFTGRSSDTNGVVEAILSNMGYLGSGYSWGILADVYPDPNDLRWRAYLDDDRDSSDWITTHDASAGSSDYFSTTGSFLVRESSVVPIPGAVWLLGSGLIGIVGIRRKFKN